MKKIQLQKNQSGNHWVLALVLLAGIQMGATSVLSQTNLVTVAVLPFGSNDEFSPVMGTESALLVATHLSALPDLILVERADLDSAIGEMELGLSGTISSESTAKIGHLLGAKILVTGRVIDTADQRLLAAKVIGVETGRVFGAVVEKNLDASIGDFSKELSSQIIEIIQENQSVLIASPVTSEDIVAKLRDSLKDGRRSVVSVNIPEQHFGAPTADPAAQTEMERLLLSLDFTVMKNAGDSTVEVQIVGEAFSAFSVRKGNLVSVQARVEARAIEKSTGKVLVSDSQTAIAIDLAEAVAAKSALQEASLKLSERMIHRIVLAE